MQTHPTAVTSAELQQEEQKNAHFWPSSQQEEDGSKSAVKEMSPAEGGAVFNSNTGFSLASRAPAPERHAALQEELPS